MDPQITLVTLGVSNLAESIWFYRDGLRLPMQEREDDNDVAFFPSRARGFRSIRENYLPKMRPSLRTAAAFSGITIAHNVATKEEVDAVLAEAESSGGHIMKPAQEVFWDGYSGYFADLDDTTSGR